MPTQQSSAQVDFDVVRCLSVSLAEKLDAYSRRLWKNRRSIALLEDNFVNRLVSGQAGQNALSAGSRLPAFILPDSDGRLVNSEELLRNGPLVVSFNRGHWCPFCRLELLAFADIYHEIIELGCELVSIMPEKGEFTGNMKDTYDLSFPVLCDVDNGYTLANGLMVSFDNDLRQAFLELGVDLAALNGNEGLFMPIPATYVVGSDGVVKYDYVNPDFRQRMSPDRIISALRSL